MAAPNAPKALGPCPTDEDLAAFLDGMLTAAERARITSHLADCESCYEVFADAVRFQQETSAVHGDRGLLPFPFRNSETRVRPIQWVGLAAAAVVVVGVGLTGYRLFFAEPKVEVAVLVQSLTGRPEVADHLDLRVFRGGPAGGGSILMGPPAFMVGVDLVELQLSLALGRSGDAGNLLTDMSNYLQQIPFADADSKQCDQDAATLRNHDSPQTHRRIAETWRSKEAELDEDFLPSNFGFGKWAEAGRLAAATRTQEFFASRNNRRFLHRLLQERTEIESDAVPCLLAIRKAWEAQPLQAADYDVLAENFHQIIDVYRQEAADPGL